MAQKYESRNDKKESSSSQRYEQKPGKGNDSGNVSSYQQKDQGKSMAGNEKNIGKELGADGGRKSREEGWMGDSSQSKEGKWLPSEANKKDGCFPKLFVLLLPFIVLGAYMYLAS